MGLSVNHHQNTGESKAFWLYAKVKHQMGSFHPFKDTAKTSKVRKDESNLKGGNSQDKVTAEPHSTSTSRVNSGNTSSSKALDARQLMKMGNTPNFLKIILSGNSMSLAIRSET